MTAYVCVLYHGGMNTVESAKPRRRSVVAPQRVRITVTLPADVGERLGELADRYAVSRATLASDAIERGMKATHEALRRAARSAAREAGK